MGGLHLTTFDRVPDAKITSGDFLKVRMVVGTILSAEPNPKARVPAYTLWVDCGALGIKQSSAQLTRFYKPEDLIGRQVVCVANFQPKNIAGVQSEVLVLGAYNAGKKEEVVLLSLERKAENGSRIG